MSRSSVSFRQEPSLPEKKESVWRSSWENRLPGSTLVTEGCAGVGERWECGLRMGVEMVMEGLWGQMHSYGRRSCMNSCYLRWMAET